MSLAAWIVLAAVALERLMELAWSHRAGRRLRARGGGKLGRAYCLLVPLLHGAWLMALAIHVALEARIDVIWPMVGVYGLLPISRAWVLWNSSERRTARRMEMPGAAPVRRGLDRVSRRANELIVTLEFAVLPIALEAWPIALVASALAIALFAYRIRIEQTAPCPT